MNTTQPPTTAGEAYESGMYFGHRSRGLPMGSVERRALCTETEAFMAAVPKERMADFLAGLSRGMGRASMTPPPNRITPFTSPKNAGGRRGEVTHTTPPSIHLVPPAELTVT